MTKEKQVLMYCFENGEIIQNLTSLEDIKSENLGNQDDVFVETYDQPSLITLVFIDMALPSFNDIHQYN